MTEYTDIQKSKISNILSEDKIFYFDYEGFVNMTPSLVGIWVDSEFSQYTFESILEPLSTEMRIAFISWDDWNVKLKELIDKGYVGVGFTMHEAEKSYKLGPPEDWYRNAHWFLKKRVRWPQDRRPSGWSLDTISKFCGYDVKEFGKMKATSRLRNVLNSARIHGNYQNFTPTAKAKWTKLLNYNKQDVEMLRYVTEFGLDHLKIS